MIYSFEQFCLDADRQELWRGAERITIEPQVLDLLHYLIVNRARVVSKDDLIANVWKGRIVSDSALTSRITAARHAIGDSGKKQQFIRTIARKGMRFIGDVRELNGVPEGDAQNGFPAAVALGFGSPGLRQPEKPSIAVLPFTNMSDDRGQEYFSDGITEDLINALSRLHWFFVIGRNSTFIYKGQAADVKQVGRDLGARYVLEGSVRKSGKHVRVISRLLDASTGNQIWSERYDRELIDMFALQDEITGNVVAAIEPRLVSAEGSRGETRSTDDLDAWDAVARALSHFWKLTAADNQAAIAILRAAVERYPNYAPAHSLLAFAIFASSYVGSGPAAPDREFAAQLARRAIELDDGDPWAYLALGYFDFTARRTEEAIRHFNAALELNPNFAAAAGSIGFALALDGQSDEAIRSFDQAMSMSPRDPFNSFFICGVAGAHYLAGRYDDAIRSGKRAVQLRPGYAGAHRILCASLAQAGHIGEARAALEKVRNLQPNISIAGIRQSVPYTAGPMEKFVEGMRKAGLT